MTEPTTNGAPEGAPTSHGADESFWDEPAATSQKTEWLAQLQAMIEQITTQAAPVMREIGAKAAELAAAAGEKAGPAAHKAAAFTGEAGLKLAERSRSFAAEIRRDQAARGEGPAAATAEASSEAESSDEPTPTGVG
jgi:hypothetical protein